MFCLQHQQMPSKLAHLTESKNRSLCHSPESYARYEIAQATSTPCSRVAAGTAAHQGTSPCISTLFKRSGDCCILPVASAVWQKCIGLFLLICTHNTTNNCCLSALDCSQLAWTMKDTCLPRWRTRFQQTTLSCPQLHASYGTVV